MKIQSNVIMTTGCGDRFYFSNLVSGSKLKSTLRLSSQTKLI